MNKPVPKKKKLAVQRMINGGTLTLTFSEFERMEVSSMITKQLL